MDKFKKVFSFKINIRNSEAKKSRPQIQHSAGLTNF
jgi:hypothetical protein